MINLSLTPPQASALLQTLDMAVRANGLNVSEQLAIIQPVVASLINDYKEMMEEEQRETERSAAKASAKAK